MPHKKFIDILFFGFVTVIGFICLYVEFKFIDAIITTAGLIGLVTVCKKKP